MPPRTARPNTPSGSAHDFRVALLRGVNVNGKNIAMADLQAIALSIGLTAPSTLLNSGNLVYRSGGGSPQDEATRLHEAIAERVGIRSTVFVRTYDELVTMLRECPMPEQALHNPSRFLVTVWDEHVTPAMLAAFTTAPVTVERFVVGRHALYTWHPDGISASTVYDKAARAAGMHLTARNWNTMQKLVARMEAGAATGTATGTA
jgi:uncharacterized protein (DUF1697 family)